MKTFLSVNLQSMHSPVSIIQIKSELSCVVDRT
ncbi:hypothetical protein RO3G_09071 [Rhizopus delemar RA 99-880]|uniref:Uncharacterized protein n=1 Tax=Rhizopus delemar (strain RA 99-880 / ATCC MYA-4621 / FGSC 9543 / NRRL 43880) TaxID=246409 RepID=I1C7D1_RHIO9|nr:hypothetical protein RO3G_09071 [Rhizopus delemar RA 99-880]|eukprot:EIE84361.1 hypothetical protein RO3G_09071 [Rhizopus delemar RA 99-880]